LVFHISEEGLRVFDSRVMRNVWGQRRQEVASSFVFVTNIIAVIKQRRRECVQNVVAEL
jgi:hypothetical protein